MNKIELADSATFRSMLRSVLRRTVPIFAASALAVSCGTVYGPEDDLQACPLTSCSDAMTAEEHKGKFVHLISKTEQRPLSKEECIRECTKQLSAKCPSDFTPDENLVVTRFRGSVNDCQELEGSDGNNAVACEFTVTRSCGVVGRRPANMHEYDRLETVSSEQQLAGAFFAELAYLEEAAVTAFAYLTKELEAYEAPEALVSLSRRAMEEEVEHAEMMKALAHRYGQTTQPVAVEPFVLRPLSEIAYENAREGCIREAYGSLMAMWQAGASEDPAVRAVMERISYEESKHAALSYGIDAWVQPQLSVEEQAQCEAIKAESFVGLREELEQEPSDALVRWAGYPPKDVALHLLQQLEQECYV